MPYKTDGSNALDYSGDSSLDDSWSREAAGKTAGGSSSNVIPFPQQDDDAWGVKQARRAAAQQRAQDSEDYASGDNVINVDFSGKRGNGLNAAKNAETDTSASGADGFKNNVTGKSNEGGAAGFQNNVSGKDDKKKGPKIRTGNIVMDKVANKLRGKGPLGTIILLMGMCMGLFSASQALAPFGFISNIMDQYNAFHSSMNTRSNKTMKRLIKGGKNTSIVKTNIFGHEKFKIKGKVKKKLLRNGVYFDKTNRILVFTDEDTGKTYGVSADERTKGNIPDELDIKDADGKTKHVKIDGDAKITYADALDTHEKFFVSVDKSTRTLKGHIAGWFDSISAKFHARIGNTRNKLKDTKQGADDEEIEKKAKSEGLAEDDENGSSDLTVEDETTTTDEDGNTHTTPVEEEARNNSDGGVDTSGDSGALKKGMTEGEVKKSMTARAKTAAAQLGKAASIANAASIACAGFKVLNSLIQTIVALQKAQVLNWGTGFFESVDKAQAGDSTTEMMFYMNKMTKEDKDGNSAWSSDAINQAFSDGEVKVKADDEYALKLSTADVTEQLFGAEENGTVSGKVASGMKEIGSKVASGGLNMSSSLATYKGCVDLQIAAGIIGAFASAAELVGDVAAAIASGGLSVVFKALAKNILKAFVFQAIMAGITMFITQIIVPQVAKILARDLISNDTIGPILGYATDDAANMYMGGQMQSASGLPATDKTVMSQYYLMQETIAEDAKYERATRSPFDMTSKHTFLGSLVNSMTPLATSLRQPLSVISNTTSLVASSVKSLLPTAKAIGAEKLKTSLSHNCGSLSNLTDDEGNPVVCDAYGNPYFTTHMDTMSTDVADVMDEAAIGEEGRNFEDEAYEGAEGSYDENPKIKERSELAKFVVACEVRESPLGQEDSRVSGYVTGHEGGTLDDIGSAAMGSVPIVGDLIDASDASTEKENIGWITGENCPKKKYKYYSRYTEDQRWLESAGIIEESAVTAFLDDYYEKYPLDNSYEGVIARYSGQTKEEVNLMLGVIEYNEFLASYDSTGAGPLEWDDTEHNYIYDSETVVAQAIPDGVKTQYVIYDDLRTRVKVA